ncbi:MAG: hypothetical protein ACOC0Z_00640 [Halohasta sp.]
MVDNRQLTRRASLRGIAATGALITGAGVSTGTVAASEKKTDGVDDIEFADCHSMAVHLEDHADEVPITIRAYNADDERIENIRQTVTTGGQIPYDHWKGFYDGDNHETDHPKKPDEKKDEREEECVCEDHDDHDDHDEKGDSTEKHVWPFDIYQFYDRAIDAGDKILSVKVGDKRFENTNECAKKYPNEYDKKGDVDTDDIGLVAICVDTERNTARFRVDNWNKQSVTVTYDVFNTDRGGELMVEPRSTTFFDVEATGSGGEATVRLFYDGEEIDVKASNTQRDCIAKDKVAFSVNDVDLSKRAVEFYVHDGTDFDRTFTYYDTVTDTAGTITVHDGPASAETFWLPAPACTASVTLFYQGTAVAAASKETELSGPVVNESQAENYETIAEAVDDAEEGDTIVVCEGQELDDTVEIDVEDLTLKGFDKPIVDGSGNSPVVDITADGVTVKELGITNPDELLGIRIGEGVDGATLRKNHIFEIGPTGELGVTGILISPGDHEEIRIDDNTIEDLEQTDDGGFATLNGILFDAEAEDPGTLTDVTVKDNKLRNLDSTTGSLGIVVQHDVDGMKIKDNRIKNVVADNDFGPGDETTFAQGISIDSPSTEEFDIVDNTIWDIESNDGFFGEDIKIESEADVGGIHVRNNNLLSAIGLNNADGDNPDVDAEDNYWGGDDGPLVIESNDDDGDVMTADDDEVDLDDVDESAVTENVDFEPFAEEKR